MNSGTQETAPNRAMCRAEAVGAVVSDDWVRAKYASIPDWCRMSGMSRTGTYDAVGRNELKAIKVGARTLIDVEAGLAWMRSLPSAQIRAPKQRKAA